MTDDVTRTFLSALRGEGYSFTCGVPCSLLATLVAELERDPAWGYVSAVREDSAIGLAVGAHLAGKRAAVFMQNSGFGVSVNALASLARLYECPMLLVISWRGEGGTEGVPVASTSKAGFVDAPEHWQMGEVTLGLLDLLQIPYRVVDPGHVTAQVAEITRIMERTGKPVALVVRKGLFEAHGIDLPRKVRGAPLSPLPSAEPRTEPAPTVARMEAVRAVLRSAGEDALVVVCNGMIGREVWTVGDRKTHFYMIGSMGLASSVALGLALCRPDRRVVCLDGDGNVLMGLGVLASIAAARPENLYHAVLDNEAHGSTGDQSTISSLVRLDAIARAAGYPWTERAISPEEIERGARDLFARKGPACLLCKVTRGNVPGIGRVALTPAQLTSRMREA